MPVPALAARVPDPVVGGVLEDPEASGAEAHKFAKVNGIPVRHFVKDEKKEEVTRSYIQAAAAESASAVALAGVAQEKAVAWRS